MASIVFSTGCAIGDPSSTAPASGGTAGAGGRGDAGATSPGGRAADGGGGTSGSLGSSGANEGGAPDGSGASDGRTGGTGGGGAGTGGLVTAGGVAGQDAEQDGGQAGSSDGGMAGDTSQGGSAGSEPTLDYAGVWTGTTSQGGDIRFVYDGAGLVELAYDWVLPICASTTVIQTPSRPPIVDGRLEYYAGGNPSADFEIEFNSATDAHGRFTFTMTYRGPPVSVPVCQGTETVTFTADRALEE
jgi:hypothetical protein